MTVAADAPPATETGSDGAPPDVPDVPDAPPDAPDPDAGPPPESEGEEAAGGEFLAGLPDEAQHYIRGLRDEAAERRVTARELEEAYTPFKAVFDGVDEQTRDAVLNLAGTLISDPENAGPTELLRVAKALTGDRFEEVIKGLDQPKYLTPEEVQAQIEEHEKAKTEEKQRAEAIAQVEKEADDLGYKDDPAGRSLLFFYAHQETEGDISKAHEKVEAYRQQIVDGFVSSQKQKNSGFPAQPSGGGEPPAEQKGGPKTLGDARSAAEARIKAALAGDD